jgi:hypothetical protein
MRNLEKAIPVIIPAFCESKENILATLIPIKELLQELVIREVVIAVSDKENGETMKQIALEAVSELQLEEWITVQIVRVGKGNALIDIAHLLQNKGYSLDTKVYTHDADLYDVRTEDIKKVLTFTTNNPYGLARGVITGSQEFKSIKGKKRFTGFQFISQFLLGRPFTGMRTLVLKDLLEIEEKLGVCGYGLERILNYINTREKRMVRTFPYWGAWQEGKASKFDGNRREAMKASATMHAQILEELKRFKSK